MNVVIDAQIINWYLAEIRGKETSATRPPSCLIEGLGDVDTAFLDEGKQIENEWRNATDPEWFDQWFPELLISGAAVVVPVDVAAELVNRLQRDYGFPRSRDVWYVHTACAARDALGAPAIIITEDLHFFDPRLRRGCTAARRIEVLTTCAGNVARYLRRNSRIEVKSVIAHCPA